jgi:hypothetical protein
MYIRRINSEEGDSAAFSPAAQTVLLPAVWWELGVVSSSIFSSLFFFGGRLDLAPIWCGGCNGGLASLFLGL